MSALISEFWGVILAALGGVVWMVRLEATAQRNVEENKQRKTEILALEDRLMRQRSEDLVGAKEARDATNVTLAEIRADVKQLLRKG